MYTNCFRRIMFNYLLTAVISAALIFMAGCGSKSENGDGSKSGQTAENTACPEKSTARVESKNGGYPAEPIDWSSIKSSAAKWGFSGLGGDSQAITVYISNTEIAPADLVKYSGMDLAAGQGIIILSFSNGQKNAEAGAYKPNPQFAAPMRIGAGIYVKGKVTVQFDDYKTEGSAEITELTAEKACGKFSLKDPWSSIEGTFSAPIVK